MAHYDIISLTKMQIANYKLSRLLFLCVVIFSLNACKQKQVPSYSDTFSSGEAKFAADESFSPIVDDENYIFKALDTKANPIIIYKAENDVVNMLLQDSVRVAIMSRKLDSDEVKALKTKNLLPVSSKFATDAVALIVNKGSNDTTITVEEIKNLLNGQSKSGKIVVFDNPGSSLVSYLKNFTGINSFKPNNVFALKSDKEVIKYVSTHPGAIGFTGFNWLDNPAEDYAEAVKNVKIVAVRDEASEKYGKQYFKPSQTTILQNEYPLIRSLYIINCTGRDGLGTGFASFLISERGQNIVLTSGLLPAYMPGREIKIEHKLN
jgi:phosphate transport system substrate-binding protein